MEKSAFFGEGEADAAQDVAAGIDAVAAPAAQEGGELVEENLPQSRKDAQERWKNQRFSAKWRPMPPRM